MEKYKKRCLEISKFIVSAVSQKFLNNFGNVPTYKYSTVVKSCTYDVVYACCLTRVGVRESKSHLLVNVRKEQIITIYLTCFVQ